jgi:hypothetical protein
MWAPFNSKSILLQNRSIENTKLEHKYGTTKSQFTRKANGAQSSIDKRHIPPKEINNQT